MKYVSEMMSNSLLVSTLLLCREYNICLWPPSTASNSLPEADRLVNRHPNAHSLLLDIFDQEKVGCLVEEADMVIRYADPERSKRIT